MAITLYLTETRSRNDFECPACRRWFPPGTRHFRHDPHPYARMLRGQSVSHWCYDCISAASPGPKELVTGRIRLSIVRVVSPQVNPIGEVSQLPLFAPAQVEVVGVSSVLSEQILAAPSQVHQLTPEQFEDLICDRLVAMGFEPKKVGATNRKDGGIDILFWPRSTHMFPFLGAAQVKHHRDPLKKEGPSTVRDFAGTIAGHPINAGLIITNTSFTPDAEWFCRERAKLLRLRGFSDISRWILNNFNDEAEWREIPAMIELCPGVTVKIR